MQCSVLYSLGWHTVPVRLIVSRKNVAIVELATNCSSAGRLSCYPVHDPPQPSQYTLRADSMEELTDSIPATSELGLLSWESDTAVSA